MVDGLKYIGGGDFLPHIPNRDLTPDEVEKFGKKMLLATGLYTEIEKPKPDKKKEAK